MKIPSLALFILLLSALFMGCNGNAQTKTKSVTTIEKKYKGQVEVIFYDVWTSEGNEAAKKFTFGAIPTQIFLDENGKEFFRHIGFFPEEELVKVLLQKGIK